MSKEILRPGRKFWANTLPRIKETYIEQAGGWVADGNVPDRFDLTGAAIALTVVSIVMYWPRPG